MRGRILLASILCAAAFSAGGPKADLTLKDSAGQKVRLHDLRGKPVVLNFWATWCGPCNDEMPLLVSLEKEYGPRGVAFVAASLDDAKTKDKIPEFLQRYHIGFPVWYGATADDLDRLELGDAVPDTVFLDREGRIVARILGQARPEELKERLDWLLRDASAAPPQALVKHLESHGR